MKIIEPFYKEYQITEEMKKNIDGIIESKLTPNPPPNPK